VLKDDVGVDEVEFPGCQHREIVASVADVLDLRGKLIDFGRQPNHFRRDVHADDPVEM
jgi:hypothetical protein